MEERKNYLILVFEVRWVLTVYRLLCSLKITQELVASSTEEKVKEMAENKDSINICNIN